MMLRPDRYRPARVAHHAAQARRRVASARVARAARGVPAWLARWLAQQQLWTP